MNEDFINYAEYGVEKKGEGKNRMARILLVCLYVVFSSLYAGFFISVRIPHLIAILPILLWILIFFTWRLVKYDCEYRIEKGEMIFSHSQSAKRKTEKLRLRVKTAERIIPAEQYAEEKGRYVYDFRGSKKCSCGYVILSSKNERKIAVFFEAIPQALKLLKRLNENTVI
jgi:hypothetical protein